MQTSDTASDDYWPWSFNRAEGDRLLAEADRKAEAKARDNGLRSEFWGEDDLRPRSKACYELVQRAVLDKALPEEATIVFGTWSSSPDAGLPPIPHTWVELPGDEIWEPVSASVGPREIQRELWSLRESAFQRSRYSVYEIAMAVIAAERYGDQSLLAAVGGLSMT